MCRLIRLLILLVLFTSSLYASHEEVSLQLQWLHQFQFAGFYIAKEQGFYDEAGLDVTIKEFNSTVNILDEVVSQNSEYGVSRSSLFIEKANGSPIVALGAIYQHSPSVLISTNTKIKTLKDIKYKNIMITNNEANTVPIMAMLKSEGVSLEDINMQEHSFKLADLIQKKTDAMACYLSNEPFFLDKDKVSYKIFNPRDYGFDFYGDIIFTSQYQLEHFPERTKAFYKASIKGWLWSFEHIEKTAQIIFEKYNTQNKSLESLIYEGKILKKLAFDENKNIGFMDMQQINKIVRIYQLTGFLDKNFDFSSFVDPLGFNKKSLHLGVLAKRGDEKAIQRYKPITAYLNQALTQYCVDIIPIDFENIQEYIKTQKIDFLLTNTMSYVQLENRYGLSRIATLKNSSLDRKNSSKYFGGVLFTKKDSKIKNIQMIKGKKFAAVNENSFGGWVMAYELLSENGLNKKDIELKFYNTHDTVVEAVLDGRAEVGTVRSDTLENMISEKKLDLSKLQILHEQKYEEFPFIVSTKLYPEWPLSKLKHTPEKSATDLMTALLKMPKDSKEALESNIAGWTVPLDYSGVHNLLKKLKLAPYDNVNFSLEDVFREYALMIYTFIFFLAIGFTRYIHVKKLNAELDRQVKQRTKSLSLANKKLQRLANIDSLTGIYNRGYVLRLAEKYFDVAKRNHAPLQVLSLDIDYFKNVNDTYGHQVGDIVLKLFCGKISTILRSSDLFGRIGGEEFLICLQNTSYEGAIVYAEKILEEVEKISYKTQQGELLTFTVSIGLAEFKDQESLEILIGESDKALYAAKDSGRNCVVTYF